jgi:cell division protein FtsB
MNPFEFVLAIVAIVIGAQLIQRLAKIRSEKSDNSGELDDAHAKIDALEERIRVLERIITENKYDLRREIDKL